MKRPTNLFLIGPMGAGKSTIGRQLARALKMDFLDSDQVIEQRTGADIPWIFDVEGEAGFRQREAQVIAELTDRQGLVLATGGGAILMQANRNNLAARGVVVYLQASIDQQLKRTEKDKRRPLLQEPDAALKKEKLQALMLERSPLYEEIADLVVSTDSSSVRAVAMEIIAALEGEIIACP